MWTLGEYGLRRASSVEGSCFAYMHCQPSYCLPLPSGNAQVWALSCWGLVGNLRISYIGDYVGIILPHPLLTTSKLWVLVLILGSEQQTCRLCSLPNHPHPFGGYLYQGLQYARVCVGVRRLYEIPAHQYIRLATQLMQTGVNTMVGTIMLASCQTERVP